MPRTEARACGREDEVQQAADGGRLAGAVGSEEAEDLALLDLEVKVDERLDVPVVLGQPLRLDGGRSVGRGHRPSFCAVSSRSQRSRSFGISVVQNSENSISSSRPSVRVTPPAARIRLATLGQLVEAGHLGRGHLDPPVRAEAVVGLAVTDPVSLLEGLHLEQHPCARADRGAAHAGALGDVASRLLGRVAGHQVAEHLARGARSSDGGEPDADPLHDLGHGRVAPCAIFSHY